MRMACALISGALLSTVLGCGSGEPPPPPTAPASGKVTFSGAPVTEGIVILENQETGAARSAKLGGDGSFQIPEVPVGKYAVTVVPPEPPPSTDPAKANPAPDPKNIPGKYRVKRTSTLTAEVKEGATNQFDFDITK